MILLLWVLLGACSSEETYRTMSDFAGKYRGSHRLYGGLLKVKSNEILQLSSDSTYSLRSCGTPETGRWYYDGAQIILIGSYYKKQEDTADSVLTLYRYTLKIRKNGDLAEDHVTLRGGPFYIKNKTGVTHYRKIPEA